MTAPRRRDEAKLQTSIVKAYRNLFDCVICHVPNGGSRNMLEAVALKNMGVLAGVPDLLVFGREGRTLLLECKAGKGKESPAQVALMDDLWDRGFTVHTVKDLETAIKVGRAFGLGPKQAPKRNSLDLQAGF